MKRITILIILFTIVIALSCKKEESAPQPPIIKFVSASYTPKSADAFGYNTIKFEFIDLNGDLGLRQEEDQGQFENNLFAEIYALEDGVWSKKTPIVRWKIDLLHPDGGTYDTTIVRYRFPFIENESKEKLEGDIVVDLVHNKDIIPYDSIRYEIYIKDRALQASNTITTSTIYIY